MADKQEIQLHRVYKHFKGDYYLVEDLARDSETDEEVVIYRKLYGDGSLWVRPLSMFLSKVDHERYPNAKQRFRFELVDIESTAGHQKVRRRARKTRCGAGWLMTCATWLASQLREQGRL